MKYRTAGAVLGAGLLVAGIGGATLILRAAPDAPPQMIPIAAGPQAYRPAGEFRQGTRVVDAPVEAISARAFAIMRFHVSEAEYAACVAAAACAAAPGLGRAGHAQTQVSHADASAYALWLSAQTGQDWRLPSDAEWLRAAGDRAIDDGLAGDANSDDPARRWIARYLREVDLRGEADTDHHPLGHFGLNDRGLADIAGNIWEWTATCFQNGTLSADGSGIEQRSDYCGVRAAQGKHRAFVIDFIRDARSGGCAVGVPPDFLGFRLVRGAG